MGSGVDQCRRHTERLNHFQDITNQHDEESLRAKTSKNEPNQMQTVKEHYRQELESTGLDLWFDEIDMTLEKCRETPRQRYA